VRDDIILGKLKRIEPNLIKFSQINLDYPKLMKVPKLAKLN